MPSKDFQDILKEMDEVHIKKNHDYATNENPFSNFERAAELVSWFKNPIDQTFAGIIGIKLARLAELLNGKVPNNESISDNGIDLSNYTVLWAAYRRFVESKVPENVKFKDIILEGAVSGGFNLSNKDEDLQRSAGPVLKDLHFKEVCSFCATGDELTQLTHAIVAHGAAITYAVAGGGLLYPNEAEAYFVSRKVMNKVNATGPLKKNG